MKCNAHTTDVEAAARQPDEQQGPAPMTLTEGAAVARTTTLRAEDIKKVEALRSLGARSVMELGWLGADKLPPPSKSLLTVANADGKQVPFLPAGKVAMLVAPGGTGKTQCLVQLAVAIASGEPWLDTYQVTSPGPVLLVLGEEDAEECHRRIRGAVDALLLWRFAEEIAENLHVMSLCGTAAGLTDDQGAETDFCKVLRDGLAASGIDWRLVILDPASRFLGPDAEKDNASATRWIEAVERFTLGQSRPTVLFAHHTSKNGLNGNTNQGAARGSSALTDGVRWQANLEKAIEGAEGQEPPRLSHDRLILKVVKVNHCRLSSPLDLWRDGAHGGALRAASAAPLTPPPVATAANRDHSRAVRERHDDL